MAAISECVNLETNQCGGGVLAGGVFSFLALRWQDSNSVMSVCSYICSFVNQIINLGATMLQTIFRWFERGIELLPVFWNAWAGTSGC
jgi:hypothetical protein